MYFIKLLPCTVQNECEPDVMLKDSYLKPTLPGGTAESKSFGRNVCASSTTATFLQQITGEGKKAKGVCILCNDSSKTVAKTNYARHFRDIHLPKKTCPRCNKEFSDSALKVHKKRCLR